LTGLILANAAAKLTVLGLQLYLIEMALPPEKDDDVSSHNNDDNGGGHLHSPGSVAFARLSMHCVSLRLLNFLCAVLETLPMGYFLACLRTPVCPVAEILIPTRRRARLAKVKAAEKEQTHVYSANSRKRLLLFLRVFFFS
jgi:hypothetical protein